MKKSEMVEHITAELLNVAKDRQHSNETDEKYCARKAEGILDMMLGFGMAPPKITILPDSYNRAEGSYGFEVHEWEEEIDDSEKK